MRAGRTDEAGATAARIRTTAYDPYYHHTQQHAVAAHYRHAEERQGRLGEGAWGHQGVGEPCWRPGRRANGASS